MIENTRRAIPYGRQSIYDEDIEAVIQALQDDFLTQGPRIKAFEDAFAAYVGARYAVAVSNGTAALHLSALALGTNSETRVLTSPITFAASANCIAYCGGKVEFVDIDPETGLIDLKLLQRKLEDSAPGTFSGVIPVDFAGAPVDLEQLKVLAKKHNLWILEDACHAPGGYFIRSDDGKSRCGSSEFADCAIFSFHPVKHIACGEGGMITTSRKDIYEKLLLLRTHGITKDPEALLEDHGGWYYEMQELGFNYRLTDIQAALGLSQLSRAKEGLARRRELAASYDKAFSGSCVQPLGLTNREGHAFHLYVVLVPQRKALYDHLRTHGIYAQIHYIPVHLQPYYQKIGHQKGSYPKAEMYYEKCISLPMYPSLSDEEAQYVVNTVLDFFS